MWHSTYLVVVLVKQTVLFITHVPQGSRRLTCAATNHCAVMARKEPHHASSYHSCTSFSSFPFSSYTASSHVALLRFAQDGYGSPAPSCKGKSLTSLRHSRQHCRNLISDSESSFFSCSFRLLPTFWHTAGLLCQARSCDRERKLGPSVVSLPRQHAPFACA